MSTSRPLTPFGSALAGALGAVFSNAAVYPLDTVKTRLQALPPSATSSPRIQDGSKYPQTRGIGAIVKRIKKMQMLSMLLRILKTEGLSGAFKGFTANMINTFSQQFAYFFFHTFLRSHYIARRSRLSNSPITSLSTSAELALGAAAGGLAQIFTIPAAVIATRQQLWTPPADGKAVEEPTFFQTASEIIAEGGPTALWTGLKPGLVLTVNPAITYGVFERLKSWRLQGRGGGKLGVAEAFWMGVASKTLATVVTYPYIFAKVRLQAKQTPPPLAEKTTGQDSSSYAAIAAAPPASDSAVVLESTVDPESSTSPASATNEKQPKRASTSPTHKAGAVDILKEVYREKGLAGWYQGLGAQIVKAVLCQGILFVSKDQFEGYAWLILDFLARLRGAA